MFALYESGQVVGAICFYEPVQIQGVEFKKELVISNIFVKSDRQRRGYGTMLLKHLEKYCMSLGTVNYLSAFVILDDQKSANFYLFKNQFIPLRDDSNILIKPLR
jgi:ribosomal protein S18 acetylase RimI-like enzyme